MKRSPHPIRILVLAFVAASAGLWPGPALAAEMDAAWLASARAKADEGRLKLERDFEEMRARTEALPDTWLQDLLSLKSLLQGDSPEAPAAPALPQPIAYGSGLWLEIRPNGDSVNVILHNTSPDRSYQLWSTEDIAAPNWAPVATVAGTCGPAWPQTNVPMNGRSILFFRASYVPPCSPLQSYSMDQNGNYAGINALALGYSPPDTMGAVGPGHFMELLNGASDRPSIAVFEKCSGSLVEPGASTNFFAVEYNGTHYPAGQQLYDPRLLYDHHENRWIASALDARDATASWNVILAVSKDSSPVPLASNWTKYLVSFPRINGSTADFPTLGLDDNGIYLAALHAHGPSGGLVIDGHTVVAIKKQAL
jgi:hypothetical protein